MQISQPYRDGKRQPRKNGIVCMTTQVEQSIDRVDSNLSLKSAAIFASGGSLMTGKYAELLITDWINVTVLVLALHFDLHSSSLLSRDPTQKHQHTSNLFCEATDWASCWVRSKDQKGQAQLTATYVRKLCIILCAQKLHTIVHVRMPWDRDTFRQPCYIF